MESKTIDVTYFLDLSKAPFKNSIFDYSHIPQAQYLDAISTSLISLLFPAILIQTFVICNGLTTTSLDVKSMYDGYILRIMAKMLVRKEERSKIRFTTFGISLILFIILVFGEGALIFSQSLRGESYSIEEVRIPKLLFMSNAHSAPFIGTLNRECVPVFFTKAALSFVPISICFAINRFEQDFTLIGGTNPESHIVMTSISRNHNGSWLSFSTQTSSNDNNITYFETIQVSAPFHTSVVSQGLNLSTLIPNMTDLSFWISSEIHRRFKCLIFLQPLQGTIDGVTTFTSSNGLCDGTVEERFRVCRCLFLSALIASDTETLTRKDFVHYSEEIPDTSIDFDNFVVAQTTVIRGYIMWLILIVLFGINLLLNSFLPDLNWVSMFSVFEHLNLQKQPLHMKQSEHFNLDTQLTGTK